MSNRSILISYRIIQLYVMSTILYYVIGWFDFCSTMSTMSIDRLSEEWRCRRWWYRWEWEYSQSQWWFIIIIVILLIRSMVGHPHTRTDVLTLSRYCDFTLLVVSSPFDQIDNGRPEYYSQWQWWWTSSNRDDENIILSLTLLHHRQSTINTVGQSVTTITLI